MSISPIRKIWISLFSILAMLMSSFVSSAPLMTFQMLSTTSASAESISDNHCGSMNTLQAHHTNYNDTSQSMTPDLPCDSDDNLAHNCCGTVCVTVFALFTPTAQNTYINSKLALIHSDSGGNAIYRQASLYRPPIA